MTSRPNCRQQIFRLIGEQPVIVRAKHIGRGEEASSVAVAVGLVAQIGARAFGYALSEPEIP